MNVMKKSRVTFDDMPALVEALASEIKGLRKVVNSLVNTSASTTESERKLLSTDDVCKLLGKTRVSIYRMIKRGELVAYKKGKNLFFFEDEILSDLESSRIRSDFELKAAADKYLAIS